MATIPYDALIESAARLTDIEALAEIDAAHASAASELIARNKDALESARRHLGPTCAVALRYEGAFFTEYCDHFSHMRNLASAFRAEAWLAASGNDFHTAARIAVDILELANAVRRGGLMTGLLVGLAISGIGIDRLRKLRTKLDTGTRRLVIDELRRLEAERESLAEVAARDRAWEIAVGYGNERCDFMSIPIDAPEVCGVSEEAQREIREELQQIADLPESERRTMHSDQDNYDLAMMRLLSIDLALRDAEAMSGEFPKDLSSLTPQPFVELPLDPFTNNAFIYRRSGVTSFDLYSTGPNLTDGGGHFGPWMSVAAGQADLCLDAADYMQACCVSPGRQEFFQLVTSGLRTWWRKK